MRTVLRILLPLILFSHTLFAATPLEDWYSLYSSVLQKYVSKGQKQGIQTTLVDYQGLRNDSDFRKVVYDLAALPSFDTFPKNDQLAMWINAYNCLILKVIVENPGIKSIKDLDSFFGGIWKKKVGIVSGRQCGLDEIEKEILRSKFQDPRIHFALNCASLSCPNLANYAYQGKYIDQQLSRQIQEFLTNPSKGMKVQQGSKRVILSKIFSWYGSEFPGSVLGWIHNQGYLQADQTNYSVSYMSYNWDLNSL